MDDNLRNNIDNEEQQLYIDSKMELASLERKNRVSDEEYQNMLDDLNATTDLEQKERLSEYLENFISESEYERKRNEQLAWINEINERYNLNESKELSVRGLKARQQLERLRNYYRKRNIGVLDNINIENLSDEAAIREYDIQTMNIEPDVLRDMLNDDIIGRLGNIDNTNDNNLVTEDKRDVVDLESIEKEINVFRETSDRINKQMNDVNKKLVLDGVEGLDVVGNLNELNDELNELREMGRVILSDMKDFELETKSVDFSMSPREINNTIKGFTGRFKDLKVMHQAKYNARVEYTNSKIDELKSMVGLDDEVIAMIDGLTKLDKSDNFIQSWTQKNYLNNIDYTRLVEVNKQIAEIQNRLGIDKVSNEVEGLESEIAKGIEQGLNVVESELGTELSDDRINELNQDLDGIYNLIDGFEQKLELNKDNLSKEEYNAYKKRVEDSKDKVNELRTKLGKNVVYSNDYKELEDKIDMLSNDVNSLDNMVNSLKGHIVKSGRDAFEKNETDLRNRLEKLMEELESKEDNMDPNQYDTLNNRLSGIKDNLDLVHGNIRRPDMIKDADIFAILNVEITDLGKSLNDLDIIVKNAEKPIKREDRKGIDKIINHLEKEINRLEKLLEEYKDKDEEKYNSTLEELNKLNAKLSGVNGEYKKKCPLMVKTVKSAKNFFKKHKKACLIIAGLAAMSLVSYHVLIPAIMHGNIMIAGTNSVLRPFIKFTNNILGGMIGATKDSVGIWTLANGVSINPSCAASSLLKGLAISGIGSTALVAPLVVAIKKLVEKMKTVELKQKLIEEKNKLKEKIPVKNEKTEMKSSIKKADKMSVDELAKLLKEYRKSGKSMDEFCKKNNLTDEEKSILQYLETRSRDNIEEMKNSGRKGR